MSYDPGVKPTNGAGIATTGHLTVLFDATTGAPIYVTVAQLAALMPNSGGTSPATTFSVANSVSTVAIGGTVTLTVTPGSGGWPSGQVVTPVAITVGGSFDASSKVGSGTTPVTFTFTASGNAASGSLSASASGMMISGNPAALTTTASTSPATSYIISTASTGTVGVAQAVTVTANGALSSATVVTLTDSASGTFAGTITLAQGTNSSGSTQYTPASTGSKTITGTNNGGLTNPTGVSVTVSAVATPSLVFSPAATFSTTSKYGSGSLSGGKGVYTFQLPANGQSGATDQANVSCGFWLLAPPGGSHSYKNFVQIALANSDTYGWGFGDTLGFGTQNGGQRVTGSEDSTWHWLAFQLMSGGAQVQVDASFDGTNFYSQSSSNYVHSGVNHVVTVDMTTLASGCLIDDFAMWNGANPYISAAPTAAIARTSGTVPLLLHPFNNSAAGI